MDVVDSIYALGQNIGSFLWDLETNWFTGTADRPTPLRFERALDDIRAQCASLQDVLGPSQPIDQLYRAVSVAAASISQQWRSERHRGVVDTLVEVDHECIGDAWWIANSILSADGVSQLCQAASACEREFPSHLGKYFALGRGAGIRDFGRHCEEYTGLRVPLHPGIVGSVESVSDGAPYTAVAEAPASVGVVEFRLPSAEASVESVSIFETVALAVTVTNVATVMVSDALILPGTESVAGHDIQDHHLETEHDSNGCESLASSGLSDAITGSVAMRLHSPLALRPLNRQRKRGRYLVVDEDSVKCNGVDGIERLLQPLEVRILCLLDEAVDTWCAWEHLQRAWGDDIPTLESFRTTISRLRSKLKKRFRLTITSKRNQGYQLEPYVGQS